MSEKQDRGRRGSRSQSPYRRRKTVEPGTDAPPADVVEDGDSSGPRMDPGQMAQLIVDMRNGVVDREASNAIAGPLSDLAKAFAMQSEVLKGVHETQVKMQEKLANDEKAELMLNSTDSLNETFRGVRNVQQKLLDELGDRGRSERRGKIVYLLLGVVALAALGWFVKIALDRRASDDERIADKIDAVRSELTPQYDSLIEASRGDRESMIEQLRLRDETIAKLREQMASLSIEAGAEDRELESLRGTVTEKDGTIAELRQRVKDLEGQVGVYLTKYEDAQRHVDRLTNEVIGKLEARDDRWLEELARKGAVDTPVVTPAELPVAKTEEPRPKETAGASPEPPAPRLGQVVKDLNKLLEDHRSSHTYRIDSVGKIHPGYLEDVVFVESAPGRGVVKNIAAKKLEISVSRQGDQVEFNFVDGDVRRRRSTGGLGPRTPFYKGRYRVTVFCLNGEKWLARSDGFIKVD